LPEQNLSCTVSNFYFAAAKRSPPKQETEGYHKISGRVAKTSALVALGPEREARRKKKKRAEARAQRHHCNLRITPMPPPPGAIFGAPGMGAY
jgi:hypothetical protein